MEIISGTMTIVLSVIILVCFLIIGVIITNENEKISLENIQGDRNS